MSVVNWGGQILQYRVPTFGEKFSLPRKNSGNEVGVTLLRNSLKTAL